MSAWSIVRSLTPGFGSAQRKRVPISSKAPSIRFLEMRMGLRTLSYKPKGGTTLETVKARYVIGADGPVPGWQATVKGADKVPSVFAYHEIVRAPDLEDQRPRYGARRCDVYYDGRFSPDFYSWVFPHGETMSIGTGSAHKGFSLRNSVARLREANGLDHLDMVRHEGAPIPLKPMKKWDNRRDVVLAGDAAGVDGTRHLVKGSITPCLVGNWQWKRSNWP